MRHPHSHIQLLATSVEQLIDGLWRSKIKIELSANFKIETDLPLNISFRVLGRLGFHGRIALVNESILFSHFRRLFSFRMSNYNSLSFLHTALCIRVDFQLRSNHFFSIYSSLPRHGAQNLHEVPEMSERQYGVATAQTKLDCVQIDGLVVLKIIKHCRLGSPFD